MIDEGMTPRDAAVRAMEEVGGPVVAIALILAAVFIPTAAIPGITGRLYQQFAITIAISVLISAFNALTLSPALAALLLKPKDHERRRRAAAAVSSTGSIAFSAGPPTNIVSTSGVLIHKSGLHDAGCWRPWRCSPSSSGARCPPAFFPRKTRAICSSRCNCRMRHRCSAPMRPRSASPSALLETPGIGGVVGVDGFSLLTQTQSTNTAFFFVSLKPWDLRKSRAEQIQAIQASVQQKLAGVSDGLAFSFPPPAIPGIGTSGGVTMILQDRSGNDDPTFLTKNVYAFLGARFEAAGDRRGRAVVSAGGSAALRRRGSRKGRRSSRST